MAQGDGFYLARSLMTGYYLYRKARAWVHDDGMRRRFVIDAARPRRGVLINIREGVVMDRESRLRVQPSDRRQRIFRPHREVTANRHTGQVEVQVANQFHI